MSAASRSSKHLARTNRPPCRLSGPLPAPAQTWRARLLAAAQRLAAATAGRDKRVSKRVRVSAQRSWTSPLRSLTRCKSWPPPLAAAHPAPRAASSACTHLAAGSTLCQEVAQQSGVVGRPAVLQQQHQAAERQAAAQQAVEVGVAAGQQRLAMQAWPRPGICTDIVRQREGDHRVSRKAGADGGEQQGERSAVSASNLVMQVVSSISPAAAAPAAPLRTKLPCRIAGALAQGCRGVLKPILIDGDSNGE